MAGDPHKLNEDAVVEHIVETVLQFSDLNLSYKLFNVLCESDKIIQVLAFCSAIICRAR